MIAKSTFGKYNSPGSNAGDVTFSNSVVFDEDGCQNCFNPAFNYYDPELGIDKTKMFPLDLSKEAYGSVAKGYRSILQKASIDSNTGGAGTAGTALIPVYTDPQVVDRTRRLIPLYTVIPRRAVKGQTYDYNVLTAKGGATFRLEGDNLTPDQDTYDRQSVSMKLGYSVGQVSQFSMAAADGFLDQLGLDISVKSIAMMELLETTIINGDATTNPEEFDGLIQTITTVDVDKLGADVALADLRTAEATAFNRNGAPTLAVTDATTHNKLKGLLLDFQRSLGDPNSVLPFGIKGAFEFDGVAYIRSQFMPTGSGAKRIFGLDMRYIFLSVLQDMTYEELAKVRDERNYMIKWYGALVISFPGAMFHIDNIL